MFELAGQRALFQQQCLKQQSLHLHNGHKHGLEMASPEHLPF